MASDREKRLERALRDLLDWRGAVNQFPTTVMVGVENDPEGIATQLFNGPVWDAAERAANSD